MPPRGAPVPLRGRERKGAIQKLAYHRTDDPRIKSDAQKRESQPELAGRETHRIFGDDEKGPHPRRSESEPRLVSIRVEVYRDNELVCWQDLGSSRFARDYEQRMQRLGFATERITTAPRPERPSKPSESQAGNYTHQVRASGRNWGRSATSQGKQA